MQMQDPVSDEDEMELAIITPHGTKEEEPYTAEGPRYIKSIILGGLDGIITTFAVVAGVAGADLSTAVLLIMGFANIVGDGISMGFGDFLSSKAEQEYTQSEHEREAWEMQNFPESEKKEMIDIYIENGFSREDATRVMDILARNHGWFVDHMMVQELGLMPPDAAESPAKSGLVTLISFMVFGIIPLLAYLVLGTNGDRSLAFTLACLLTSTTLFCLGLLKGRLANQPYLKSGFFVLLNGTTAACAAYTVGWGLGQLTGETCQ